jgi:hypothetical protein
MAKIRASGIFFLAAILSEITKTEEGLLKSLGHKRK